LPLLVPRLIDRSRPPAGSDLGFEALLRGRIRTAEAVRSLPQVSCSSGPLGVAGNDPSYLGSTALDVARPTACSRTRAAPLAFSVFSPAASASSVSR
jgi:hypothetical protein